MAEIPLRDIHTMPPPAVWPPAPGWWLVAVIVLAGLVWMGFRLWRIYRRARFRRALMAELSGLMARFEANRDLHGFAEEASSFLRRLIVHVGGHGSAAALVGPAWSDFLSRAAGDQEPLVQASQELAEAPYRPEAEVDPAAVGALIENWIEIAAREAVHV